MIRATSAYESQTSYVEISKAKKFVPILNIYCLKKVHLQKIENNRRPTPFRNYNFNDLIC